jgi:hypothetical protein
VHLNIFIEQECDEKYSKEGHQMVVPHERKELLETVVASIYSWY